MAASEDDLRIEEYLYINFTSLISSSSSSSSSELLRSVSLSSTTDLDDVNQLDYDIHLIRYHHRYHYHHHHHH